MEPRRVVVAQHNKGWRSRFQGILLILVGLVGLLGIAAQYEEHNYPLFIMFAVLAPIAIIFGILLFRHGSRLLNIPLPEETSHSQLESLIVPEVVDISDEN